MNVRRRSRDVIPRTAMLELRRLPSPHQIDQFRYAALQIWKAFSVACLYRV
jgi:hypothetical protein